MREQHGPIAPVARRTSATQEDLEARRQTAIQQCTPTSGGMHRTITTRQPVRRLTDDYPPAGPHRVGPTPGLRGKEVGEDEEADYPDEQPRRRTTVVVHPPTKATRRLPRTRFHPLVFVGIGLFVMIAGWLAFSALSSWWSVKVDDWQYGMPRTYQTDAVVGHGDSQSNPSHFIAIDLNGQILVIEVPGGNASKAQIYIGPRLFGAGEDLAAVTLSFEDRNGDGKPDLNIHIEGSDRVVVFLNDGQKFVPTQQQP